MIKTAVISTLLMIAATQAHANFPACAAKAAAEFKIPEKVFHAMVLEVSTNPDIEGEHYGPMGLYDLMIPFAADGIGEPEDAVRTKSCVNYYAAAWWLMNEAGGSDGDIWDAVAAYYYGLTQRENYPMRDRVRAIYERL